MLPTEGLNDIVEDPISEWGDDPNLEEEADLYDELDAKTNTGPAAENQSARPKTNASTGSQLRTESRRARSKQSHPSVFDGNERNFKRDPTIESIIETRKSAVIDNVYTQIAQITSRSSQSHRWNSLKTHSIPPKTANQVRFSDAVEQADNNVKSFSAKNNSLSSEKDPWDDGLNTEFDKESIASIDKSSLQVYEETCKRLNICPSSMVIRSLNTTRINLENYGLGSKGSAALAVALVRNINVVSLNLSGNDIGNSGMSHIYQIMTENTYVEEYDLSQNNLGAKGIRKLAAAMSGCLHLRTLSVAGNDLTGSDINALLTKLEDHPNLKDLNISHNPLDEDGGMYLAKWLSDNNVLINLNASWCSFRLMGTRALAKAIGDNNKLLKLDLSNNSFMNDTLEQLTESLTRNMTLQELSLASNEFFCRYDTRVRGDPSILLVGKEAIIYRMFVAAATNQALKIFRIGKNHLDARSVMILLEALAKLENISLEELDFTGLTVTSKQIGDIEKMFVNHGKLTCYVGPVRQTVEQFANNLLNAIDNYCREHQVQVGDLFDLHEERFLSNTIISALQLREGLRKAKIPFPAAQLNNIIKHLVREEDDDNDDGTIPLRLLKIG